MGFGYREGGWPFHDGLVELKYDQGGVRVVNHRCPMDSISLVSPFSSLHHHPHQFPQLSSLRKFLWTPLLMEAPFAVTSQHDSHHIPQPEASLGNGELGDGIWGSHNKSSAQGKY